MLFGHQNDSASTDDSQVAATDDNTNTSTDSQTNLNPLAVDPQTGVSLPTAPEDQAETVTPSEPLVLDEPQESAVADLPADEPTPAAPVLNVDDSAKDEDLLSPPTQSDDLLTLKQQALQQLSPLVDHLDQTPEEKFRTTMMMIQSADNQTLIKSAYEAAQQITDEKVRAQALLDVVNEINYFTQHSQEQ